MDGVCQRCGGSNWSARGVCRPCRAEYMREWNAANPDKAKANAARKRAKSREQTRQRNREYRERNKETVYAGKRRCEAAKVEQYKAVKKAWYERNKAKVLAQCKAARAKRLAADPDRERRKRAEQEARRRRTEKGRVHSRMSQAVRGSLKKRGSGKGGRRWESLVGYTLDALIAHLKTTMPAGHTWDDYLAGRLQLDHKRPVSRFDFRSTDDPEFKACWALDNLQLLTREENARKRAQFPYSPALTLETP